MKTKTPTPELNRQILDEASEWFVDFRVGDVDTAAREGDRLRAGSTELEVLDTPGHTPGSISLWIPSEKTLISGDTLFRDSIGRTDLPGGDSRQILRSIRDKLLPLPDDAIVIPGHGDTTTIGRERELNYFLQGL
jgi:glyoxylase-like metal-dependent hydrolase (beta-lactamase superfamily II)